MDDLVLYYNFDQLKYVGYKTIEGCNWPIFDLDGYNTFEALYSLKTNSHGVEINFPEGEAGVNFCHAVYVDIANACLNIMKDLVPKPSKYNFTRGRYEFIFSGLSSGQSGDGYCRVKSPFVTNNTMASVAYYYSTFDPVKALSYCPFDTYDILLRYKTTNGGYGLVVAGIEFTLFATDNWTSRDLTNRLYLNPFNDFHYFGYDIPYVVPNDKPDTGIILGPAPEDKDPDPMEPGGESGEGDEPPGTFDDTSDPIPDSPLPTLSMAATGFTRIFNPSLSQVQQLARYMWTDESFFQTAWNKIKQVFEDPMDALIAFNIVPVQVPNGSPIDFTIMYIPTGVMLSPALTQFVDVDCGSYELKGYYGSALDYSPYTKVHCYLPYIGMVSLDTDEVMNNTISVKYRVDIVSGECVAKILVDNNVLYQYTGHCSISVPFTSSDFSVYANALIGAATIVGGVAGGIAGGISSTIVGEASQQTSQIIQTTTTVHKTRNPSTGRQVIQDTWTDTVERPVSQTKASFNGLSPANISNTVGSVMGGKPIAQHSGSFNGNSGYLGIRYPYLIIEVPRQCLPSSYKEMNGYPSMITMNLGQCVGYTRVQQVQLTGLSATNPEQAEILELLKGGVIL